MSDVDIQYTSLEEGDDIDATFRARASRAASTAPPPANDTKKPRFTTVGQKKAADDETTAAEPEDNPNDKVAIPKWTQTRPVAPAAEAQETPPKSAPPSTAPETKPQIKAALTSRDAVTMDMIRDEILAILESQHTNFVKAGISGAEEAGKRIHGALSKVITEQVAKELVTRFETTVFDRYIKRFLRWPALVALGIALILFAVSCIAIGMTAERAMLGAAYARDVAALHVSPSLHDPQALVAVGSLIARNNAQTLVRLARCAPDLGLRQVRSRRGEMVCVGGLSATEGFRSGARP